MSRSYTVLATALVAFAGIGGYAHLSGPAGGNPTEIVESEVAAPGAVEPDLAPSPVAFADEVREALGLAPVTPIEPDCTLSIRLDVGVTHPEVACLESKLIAAGVLSGLAPDQVFDATTAAAVREFQEASGLVVDGVVGPQTANELGSWVGPDVLPPDPDTCPAVGRAAVVDRFNQRSWLCEAGAITELMPITSAISQPDPGTYQVYAKELHASSGLSGEYSTMTHFVAFTHGKYQGARIAFHSIPKYRNGEYVQPLDSVGSQALFGDSSGCIRVLPEHAEMVWEWLDVGDTVTVIT